MTVTPATLAPVSITARPLRCRNCGAERAPAPVAICDQCLGPLDPVYDPTRRLPDRATIAGRAPSLWRYQEWLPFLVAPQRGCPARDRGAAGQRSEEHPPERQP